MADILVVDDEDFIRDLFRVILEQNGHRIIAACNGSEGLRYCGSAAIDLVITDIMMPEMDGLELITALRRMFPALKIIAISGGDPRNMDRARELGAQYVFAKPIRVREMLATVQELLCQT